MEFKDYKIEIYVPEDYIIKLRDALNKVNACKIGNYDNCISYSQVKGYWRPLDGANPFNGEVGSICSGSECKMEIRCRREFVSKALKTIREIHPYEEPLINVLPVLNEYFE